MGPKAHKAEFRYRTRKTWSRPRRACAKADRRNSKGSGIAGRARNAQPAPDYDPGLPSGRITRNCTENREFGRKDGIPAPPCREAVSTEIRPAWRFPRRFRPPARSPRAKPRPPPWPAPDRKTPATPASAPAARPCPAQSSGDPSRPPPGPARARALVFEKVADGSSGKRAGNGTSFAPLPPGGNHPAGEKGSGSEAGAAVRTTDRRIVARKRLFRGPFTAPGRCPPAYFEGPRRV